MVVAASPPIFDEVPSFVDPRGPAAERIADLWWLMLAMAIAVGVITFGLLALAALRRRRSGRVPLGESAFVSTLGIGMPLAVFTVLMGLTIGTGAAVYAPREEPGVTIDVVGHQFWWEVRYPGEGVVTANEIHIPVGEPVRLTLTSADVVHNFWVPQLHGKMYMIPGRENTFWLEADEPGEYRGICAEYCGIQHARMHKLVVAETREDFDAWLQAQRREAVEPTGGTALAGQEVFVGAACIQCHAIRGLGGPEAPTGPDLTHLASRRTFAAAMLENNRGNLGGWLLDPQSLKPGVRMPPTQLEGEDLQALLDYLETLE